MLICPLDWGMGHASRIMPLVSQFKSKGYQVILAGSGKSGQLLKSYFTEIPFINFYSVPIRYPFREKWFALNIILQIPVLLWNFVKEHIDLKAIIRNHKIDIVISDNRYGLYNRKTRNILITHQISPVLPHFLKWAEFPLYRLLKWQTEHFDECWIPDLPGESNLTGNLSHKYNLPSNARFIGVLSRFSLMHDVIASKGFDVVIVLSGPQPELRKMTIKMVDQAISSELNILIICSFQNEFCLRSYRPGLRIVPHLEPDEFKKTLVNAGVIISTAGYSGIMDLLAIGKPAILIPTTGQTEQEYLCNYLHSQKYFFSVSEKEINLGRIHEYIEELKICRPFLYNERDLQNDPAYFNTKTITITEKPRRKPV